MTTHSRLELALKRGLDRGGDLIREVANLSDYPIRQAQDAYAICLALARLIELPPEIPDSPIPNRTPVDWLAGLFQQVETPAAFDVIVIEGMPQLYSLFDQKSDRVDVLFLLKLFALYRTAEGAERIRDAARDGIKSDGLLWSTIFRQFDPEHPFGTWLANELRSPLPTGFIAVAYLDWVNALALAGLIEIHPFDCEEGRQLLSRWLTDSQPSRWSYAQSAAASLPFIETKQRDDLLNLALDHTSPDVQIEGAWASARIGGSAGIHILSRMCLEPMSSKLAIRYLRELDREDAIPEEAFQPDFQATSDMITWLSHPQEFGKPPDEIKILARRELYWPPTRDRRHFWIFHFTYRDQKANGVGLVGSVTFSLPETQPEMLPEDIFALHCAWELERQRDPRSKEIGDIVAARKFLAQHQEGF